MAPSLLGQEKDPVFVWCDEYLTQIQSAQHLVQPAYLIAFTRDQNFYATFPRFSRFYFTLKTADTGVQDKPTTTHDLFSFK
jgi:hypothetical protein